MADAGRHAADAAGTEPTATAAATADDAPPSATDAVAPGAVVASADAAPASATDRTGRPDGAVPDVPRRPGLPRLALVAIVAGSLVLVLAGARERPRASSAPPSSPWC